MRVLVTIPHIFKPQSGAIYASRRSDPRPRLAALRNAVTSLHQLFGSRQYVFDFDGMCAWQANARDSHTLQIIICTTGKDHLLPRLGLPPGSYTPRRTSCDPMMLGFECQIALQEAVGAYDYYCYLEDDIIIRDPWLFAKLAWFTHLAGSDALLQPNRYERDLQASGRKAYVDGQISPEHTARFRGTNTPSRHKTAITGSAIGREVTFERALNPHSGCYFLNARQMEHWARQAYFLDRDTSFIGPLESAATLGIMRTFDIYKPTSECASFFEVEHYGAGYIAFLGDHRPDQDPPYPLDPAHSTSKTKADGTTAARTQDSVRSRRQRRR